MITSSKNDFTILRRSSKGKNQVFLTTVRSVFQSLHLVEDQVQESTGRTNLLLLEHALPVNPGLLSRGIWMIYWHIASTFGNTASSISHYQQHFHFFEAGCHLNKRKDTKPVNKERQNVYFYQVMSRDGTCHATLSIYSVKKKLRHVLLSQRLKRKFVSKMFRKIFYTLQNFCQEKQFKLLS